MTRSCEIGRCDHPAPRPVDGSGPVCDCCRALIRRIGLLAEGQDEEAR